jgi:hypothetical protein
VICCDLRLTAKALGEIGLAAAVAVPVLLPLRLYPNSNVRYYAAQALKQIGSAENAI